MHQCLQPYDNALLRVELLPPQKAEALAYLDGNGPRPLRQGLFAVPYCCQPYKGCCCAPASDDLSTTSMMTATDHASGVVHCVCTVHCTGACAQGAHQPCLSAVCILRQCSPPCRYGLAIVQRGEMDPPDIMEYSVSCSRCIESI